MNSRLAIAIPTYNRATLLSECLYIMLPELIETEIGVYISDDSTDSSTELEIIQLQKRYPNIFYYRNDPRLGHDLNCFATLSLPKTDYVWYLGDTTYVIPGKLKAALSLLDAGHYDFLSFRSITRRGSIYTTGIIADYRDVLLNLTWHITMTGATIYNSIHLDDLNAKYGKFIGTNFPQLGIILEEFKNAEYGYYWSDDCFIDIVKGKKDSYWKKDFFEVFTKNWVELFDCIETGLSTADLSATIKSHSIKTGMFEKDSLEKYRIRGTYNMKTLIRYHRFLVRSSGMSAVLLFLIAVIPKIFLRIMRKLHRIPKGSH